MCDVFIISGIKKNKFKSFTKDNDLSHILDERKEASVKLEVLDYYPNDQPFESLTYLQGIEKVCMPDSDLFIIELKGHHINPNAKGKSASDKANYDSKMINNNKTLGLFNNDLKSVLVGSGVHRRWKDYSDQVSIINSYDFYHFTLTEGTGQRRYLTSIIFFELWLDIRNKRAFLVPMVYSLVSWFPVFTFQKQWLTAMFNDWLKNLNMKLFNDIPKLFKFVDSDHEKLSYSYSLVVKRIGFFISLIFTWLKASSSGEVINIFKTSEGNKSLIKYENSITSSRQFKIDNFDYSILFSKIKIKVLIQLYAAILLERKIIIVTGDTSSNAIIIETLQALLYPMKWNLFSVAVITADTSDFLDAPFPYIIGTHRETWAEIKPYKWRILPDEVFVVDIESNKVLMKEPLPPLPPTFSGVLETTLESHLSKLNKIDRSSTNSDRDIEEFWAKTSLSIKQEFLYFLIFLMNDFVECYKNHNSRNPIEDGPELTCIEDIFRYEKYLK